MALATQTGERNSDGGAAKGGSANGAGERVRGHRGGLLLVGLFKMSKAIFFTVVGVGAFHMIHRDLGDTVMKLAYFFHADPGWHIVRVLEDRADLVSNHQLRGAGWGALAYAAVCVVEGLGLLTEQSWAEYFTVTLTVMALPWELFEIYREPTALRFWILGLNLLVLVYLLLVIWWTRRAKARMAG